MVDRINTSNYLTLLNYSNLYTNLQTTSDYLSNYSSIYDEQLNNDLIDQTDYIDDLRSKLNNLSESSEEMLTAEAESVFDERTASSSNTDVVTAEDESKAEETTYDLNVTQLAVAQENTSASFDSSALNDFTEGDNTFKIGQSGEEAELTVNVEATDTNYDVLSKMETKINESNLDVTADVAVNDDGSSSLQVVSDKTGINNKFAITDISGDLVTQTGVDTVSQTAVDAEYSVDGTDYLSSSNEVTVDEERVTLQLQNTGEAEVTVTNDKEAVTDAVKGFVEDYNNTVEFLRSDLSNSQALELADSITDITQFNEDDLMEIGIEVGQNGRLDLDEDEFAESLTNQRDQVEEVLGSESGFVSQINNKVEDTLSQPISSYVDWQNSDSTVDTFSNFNFYDQTGQNMFPFSFMQTGMMFDFYF